MNAPTDAINRSSGIEIPSTQADPAGEYSRRLVDRRDVVSRLDRGQRRLGDARLVACGLALVLGWLAYSGSIHPGWIALPLAICLPLTLGIVRFGRSLRGARRAVLYYEAGLARLEDRWAGNGEAGERYRDPLHPYADDLDLFGSGSLFERLCGARTQAGQDRLAG